MNVSIWFRTVALFLVLLLAAPLTAISQEGKENVTSPESDQKMTQEELAQLLAPIALYPDELLSQILMASTYPLEIVAADRWLQKNRDLKGEDLAEALEKEEWDPSVKSLVNFPSVLSMMSQKLEITAKIGDAFLGQESDVMDTVQLLRKKALEAGNLKTTKEQKVVTEDDAVIIEPAEPEVVYVPTYDPMVVYGPWFYPDYPPYSYYLYPPPFGFYAFGPAVSVGFAWGYAWGGFNWHRHSTYIDVYRHRHHIRNRHINHSRYIRHYERRGIPVPEGRGRWIHDSSHRRGVSYRDPRTAERFKQPPARTLRSRERQGTIEKRDGKNYRIDKKGPVRVAPDRERTKVVPGPGGSVPPMRREGAKPPGSMVPRKDSGVRDRSRDGTDSRPRIEHAPPGREGIPGGGTRRESDGRRFEDSGSDRGRGSHR